MRTPAKSAQESMKRQMPVKMPDVVCNRKEKVVSRIVPYYRAQSGLFNRKSHLDQARPIVQFHALLWASCLWECVQLHSYNPCYGHLRRVQANEGKVIG